jgi:predicted ribosome quality control (RQC) complex YloA/Tae2 family protein
LKKNRVKTQPSSFDLAVLSAELDRALKDYYVDNIYQVNPTTLLVKLNKPASPVRNLLIEAGRRVHLTAYSVEKPLRPPPFCSALRKYLLNGRVSKVEQPDFERMLILHIFAHGENFKLAAEFFGKGNIILTDGEDKVLHALAQRKTKDRLVARGRKLAPPPPLGLGQRPSSPEILLEKLKLEKVEVVKALTRIYGIGGTYAEEILLRAGVDKKLAGGEVTFTMAERIFQAAQRVFREIEDPRPSVVLDEDGEPLDVVPFPLQVYSGKKVESYPSLNEAFDEYFTKLETGKAEGERQAKVASKLGELKRILKEQEAKLGELEKEEARHRKAGETIFHHSLELQSLLREVEKNVLNGKPWPEISREIDLRKNKGETPYSWVVGLNPKDRRLRLSVEGLEFDLTVGKSVYENASAHFQESKDLRGKISSLKEALGETQRKMEALEKDLEALREQPLHPVKVKEKKWFEKFRFFFTSGGFLVVAGRDASSNEALVKRYAEPEDRVFHTDIAGAPFAVVKTGGKQPSESDLREAAQFAVCYSRAWREGLNAADAYHVNPGQLSKAAPSGQYLGRGAFSVSGPRMYIRNIPLRIALGVKLEGGMPQVYAAPPQVFQPPQPHVVLAPGNLRAKELALKVRSTLAGKTPKEWRDAVLKIPLEDFIALIPYGRGCMVS